MTGASDRRSDQRLTSNDRRSDQRLTSNDRRSDQRLTSNDRRSDQRLWRRWMSIEWSGVERALQSFHGRLLALLDELPGGCGFGLGGNRILGEGQYCGGQSRDVCFVVEVE